MTAVTLSASTGNAAVDTMVCGVVGIFEAVFAQRLRSCYVEGSYADGTELATSDIDLTLVFKDRFLDDAERTTATQIAGYCAALSGVELEIDVVDEAQLAEGVYPSVKSGSLCLYGEDRREHLPLISIEEWTRQRMHAAYWLLVRVFKRPSIVTFPLPYPDPHGPFYGYDQRTVRLPTGAEVHCTRDLVRVTGWIATALVAYRAGIYVARKSDCHRAYRRHVNDAWAPLVEDIYRRCRTEWGYLIPAEPPAQRTLRALCERTLHFENHFLAVYKTYLLAELRTHNEPGQNRALWVLRQIVYGDNEVRQAVQALTMQEGDMLQQAAAQTLARFEQC